MAENLRISKDDVTYIRLEKDEDIRGFSCSEPLLNAFLYEDASDDAENKYSVTHLVKYNNEIVGFFTLVNDTINVDLLNDECYSDYPYRKMPAVKIARLATDERYVHRGVGSLMLRQIFIYVDVIASLSGCRVITVDAKKEALGFYRRYAFRDVRSKSNLQYIPMYLDFKFLLEEMQ